MKINLTAFTLFLIAVILSVSGCNNATTNKAKDLADSAATRIDSTVQDVRQDAKMTAAKAESMMSSNPDSDFVVKASLDNAMEIRLLQAGIDNGSGKLLKADAKSLITDHKRLGASLKAYAGKKGYILVNGDNGKADDELATLNKLNKGPDWDKELDTALVSGHHKAIDLFEKARDNVKDSELKDMINDALPTLQAHLDMMLQLQGKLGN